MEVRAQSSAWVAPLQELARWLGRLDDGPIQPVAVSKRWLVRVRDGHVTAGRADAQPRGAFRVPLRALALSPKS